MSRRAVFAAIAVLAVAWPVTAQYSVSNSNSIDTDNGIEFLSPLVGTTTVTTGNVAGSGTYTVATQPMAWQIIPGEALVSTNGTSPGTMEMTNNQQYLFHSYWGYAGGGTPAVDWDVVITPVTLTNPGSGLVDGGRYPDFTAAPLVTILGGPSGLPPPGAGCPPPITPAWDGYIINYGYATATPGSGINLPANGQSLAWVWIQPAGMVVPAASPDGCENGGNVTIPLGLSNPSTQVAGGAGAERVNINQFATKNPFGGRRSQAAVTTWAMRREYATYSNWVGFRQPILTHNYFMAGPSVAPVFVAGTPERGSGSYFMDGTAATTVVSPGFRTQATGHLGQLVVHVLTSDPVTFPPFAQPGIPVTPTSNLLLNPADPNFFLLTPAFDTLVAFYSALTGEYVNDKDLADTPMPFGLTGGFAAPGINYLVQAFVIDLAASPVAVESTNVLAGNLY